MEMLCQQGLKNRIRDQELPFGGFLAMYGFDIGIISKRTTTVKEFVQEIVGFDASGDEKVIIEGEAILIKFTGELIDVNSLHSGYNNIIRNTKILNDLVPFCRQCSKGGFSCCHCEQKHCACINIFCRSCCASGVCGCRCNRCGERNCHCVCNKCLKDINHDMCKQCPKCGLSGVCWEGKLQTKLIVLTLPSH
jgi:hypothetical protein